MRFTKKEERFLGEVIGRWEKNGVVPPETAEKLRGSCGVRPADWGGLAKWAFATAAACGAVALSAAVLDEELLDAVADLFSAPYAAARVAVLGALSAAVFAFGFFRKRKRPERVFSGEAVFFAGVLLAAQAAAFLAAEPDGGAARRSLIFFLAAVLYAGLGTALQSKSVWAFALLSFAGCLGAETGYASGWGAYYLGLKYPLRILLFGGALVAASGLAMRSGRLAALRRTTFVCGLFALFLPLWLLSIFGDYSPGSSGRSAAGELLAWSVVFALAAAGAAVYGLKRDDAAARGIGLTFFFINLYTKYFEYFWDGMHKAVFFLLLAASFWLLGRKAEAVWNLDFRNTEKEKKK